MNRTKLAALGIGALLALGTVVVPAITLAAGNTITVSPATTNTSNGSSFTVNVTANGTVAISGAGAALNFDKTRLTLTAIAKDATEVANGVSYAGFPTAANTASFIAAANGAGQIPTIAWTYTDGASNETAGAEHGIFSATFQAIACGSGSIDPIIVAGVGGLLDGTAAGYGASLSPITTVSGAVANPCPTATPAPTTTPVPTPTPVPASAPPGSGTTTVTGTLDSGFLGLTVPSNVVIPLVRNATNTKDVSVTIFSNILWNLQVSDPKLTHTGFMTDGTKVLSNAMSVLAPVSFNANLSSPTTPQTIQSGSNSAIVVTTLSQFVAGTDPAGSYGIQVLYSAVSGF